MKKIISGMLLISGIIWAELPSFQCVETYGATYITHEGTIKPAVNKASGMSKLNVSIVIKEKKGKKYIENLRVNGNDFHVTMINKSYVYAVEFTANAMHSWVLFDNKDGKPYITLSKTYDFLGAPMALYSLYSCERVNNTF